MMSKTGTAFSIRRILSFTVIIFYTQMLLGQSFLHTKGTDIVDESGKKINLRGVGLGNWLLPEGYMWKFGKNGDRPRKIEQVVLAFLGPEKADQFWKSFRKNYITEADIKRMADLGYNSVRPALNARLFLSEGENNVFIDEGFELLDNLISWCKKYNMYVIIDMHGAPGGQTGQNIDDSPADVPELFTNPKNQDLLEKLWVKIATRYKDDPTVAAYDLLNEPLPENTGAAEKYKDQLVPLYKRLIKAIRAIDKKHMFTIEGYNWANNWSLFDQALDNNIIYQFHYYCWNQPDHLNNISYYLQRRNILHTPVWVGETGEKNNAIYFATTQYFEQNNIGWSFWPWKKMDTKNTPFSITPPEGWNYISDFSENGTKPDHAIDAEKIFNMLLENIQLKNCTYFPDVVNSMFQRIPLKIEAENYGQAGFQKSYFVKDTAFRSVNYRTEEPVPVKLLEGDNTQQCIELKENEWVDYLCRASKMSSNLISLKVKTISPTSVINISVNGKKSEINLSNNSWEEIQVAAQPFRTGENHVQLFIKKGSVQVDWMEIH